MREKGQYRIGGASAVVVAATVIGVAGLGAFVPEAVAAPAHAGALSKAYQKTVGQKTSDVSLSVNETAAGQTIKITASGAFDYADNEGNLRLNLDLGSGVETVQEVLANGQAYIQLPAAEQSLLGGKQWVAVAVGGSGSSGVSGESPTSALALLQANATNVTKVGSATIDGVPTTEYRAKVNPNKTAAKLSPDLRKTVRQALSQYSGLRSVPIQVWIDRQNRIRRIKETVNLNPNAGSSVASVGAVHVSTTVDLSNYGVAVAVAPPPPDQVSHQSLSQLGGGTESGSSTS